MTDINKFADIANLHKEKQLPPVFPEVTVVVSNARMIRSLNLSSCFIN